MPRKKPLARRVPPPPPPTGVPPLERRRGESTRAAVYRISEAAHTASSLDDLYRAIHGIVGELMPAKNFYFALFDPDTGLLSFPYFVDETDPAPAPKRPGRGLTEYVLRTGRPALVTPERMRELREAGEVDLVGADSIDWMGVPLTAEGGAFGVLVVQTYTPGVRYTEEMRDVLQFVSTQVAMAIQRKRAEQTLRRTLEQARVQAAALAAAANAIMIMDRDGRIEYVNEALCQLTGYRLDDLIGERPRMLRGAEHDERFAERLWATLRAGEVWRGAITNRRKDGSEYVIEATITPLREEGGAITRFVAVAEDITGRRHAQQQLAIQAAALDAVANAIILCDRDLRIEWVNRAFIALTGYLPHEVVGQTPAFLRAGSVDAGTFAETAAAARAGVTWRRELVNLRKDGTPYTVDVVYTPVRDAGGGIIRYVGVAQDVTERRQLEDQLRQAQKLEAIGQLAGGVAHDFNNLLTTVLAAASLLREALPADIPAQQDVAAILDAAEYGGDLTRKLLAFSRRQPLELRPLALDAVVRDFGRMARRLVAEDVSIDMRIADGDATVRADRGAVEQILMNLVTNARDAMPDGGELSISVDRTAFDELRVARQGWGQPGPYVVLQVRDTGAGMDDETRRRIFEPFFTTKPVGRGTGLGLSMVYGLVKEHGGFITVDSVVGRGTGVAVNFPATASAVEQRGDGPAPGLPVGHETILLVEDNPALRETTTRVLERFGYRVRLAQDGVEALDMLRAGPPPDLIISDIVMPRLGGPQLLAALREAGLATRLIFTSGYATPEVQERLAQEPGVPFLAKPWTMAALLQLVRRTLDA